MTLTPRPPAGIVNVMTTNASALDTHVNTATNHIARLANTCMGAATLSEEYGVIGEIEPGFRRMARLQVADATLAALDEILAIAADIQDVRDQLAATLNKVR